MQKLGIGAGKMAQPIKAKAHNRKDNIKITDQLCGSSVAEFSFKMKADGAGEMTQWFRALPALPGDLDLIPSACMVAHNGL